MYVHPFVAYPIRAVLFSASLVCIGICIAGAVIAGSAAWISEQTKG